MRCPFGCRGAHRRRESIRRSTEYYRDPEGRKYKRHQNQRQQQKRRCRRAAEEQASGEAAQPGSPCLKAKDGAADPAGPTSSQGTPPAQFQPPPGHLLEYIGMVVSLIEERPVSRAEILEMLQRVLRQHTMCRRRRIDHTVAWLHERPP